MSKYNNQKNSQIKNKMYDIINNIEGKLSENNRIISGKTARNSFYDNYKYPNNYSTSTLFNKNDNNINQLTNYELRKIIKEEFDSLYKPYNIEINDNFSRIRAELNNIYELNNEYKLQNNMNDKNYMDNILKEIKKSLKNFTDYLSINDFNKKIKELEEKININNFGNNSNNNNNNNYPNKGEIKSMSIDIQDIKNKYNDINTKFNNYIKNNSQNDELKSSYDIIE